MRILTEIFHRLRAFFRNRRIAEEVDAELRQHLEFMIEDYIAEGMSPSAARRRAMQKFGNVEKHKEDARDAWGNRVLLDFLRNFRFGWRLCGRYPESSILAIIVLALGIGIASVVFTASSQFLQLNVGGKIDDRQVYLRWQGKDRKRRGPSTQELNAMVAASRSMKRLVGIRRNSFSFHPYDREAEERQIDGATTSANFFQLAEQAPAIGRTFLPEDLLDEENAPVVISDSLWNEFYDRSPAAVGAMAIVNGQPRRIVGVMPQGFAFPRTENIWLPTSWREFASLPAKDAPWIDVYGTLQEEVTLTQAQEELRAIAAGFQAENPNPELTAGEYRLLVGSLREVYLGNAHLAFLGLGSAVALMVLLLCASNVFHVIMARTARRAHELATRCSLGAPRGHVVAQVLVDGVTLALLGAVLGLGIAKFGLDELSRQLLVFDLGEAMDLQMSSRVVWFALAAAVFTGALAALIPAWRACRIDAFAVLKDDAPGSQGIHASRLSRNLLVFQVGCSALLLWVGLVALGELSLFERLNFPFNPKDVLTAKLRLRYDPALREPAAAEQFRRRLEERLSAAPGVRGVAFTSADHAFFGEGTRIEHDGWDPTAGKRTAQVEIVSPSLLEVYGLRPVKGRMINAADTADARKVCVVNQDFTGRYFPNEDPTGKVLKLRKRNQDSSPAITIVGVIPSIKPLLPAELGESTEHLFPKVYLPFAQKPHSNPTVLVGANEAAHHQFARAIRESVRELSPQVRIDGRIMTVAEMMGILNSLSDGIRVAAQIFGVVVLITAIIGLYSMVAFTTNQRRREIGIRMALGANTWDVIRSVLRPWMKVMGLGLALGGLEICIAMFALLYFTGAANQDNGFDGARFGLTLGIVWIAVVLACLVAMAIPMWRASKLRPMEVIGSE